VLYAGLCVAVNNTNNGWTLTAEEEARFDLQQDGDERSWWSSKWVYLLNDSDCPNFRKGSHNDTFYKLFDDNFFNEFIQKCVERINTLWEEWKMNRN
jgi:Leu/Phe-tRNA-protein transferase